MVLRSFDRPAQRPVPSPLIGVDSRGTPTTFVFTQRTIVLAVKPDCDGCREFLTDPPVEFEGLDVVLVSVTPFEDAVSSSWPFIVAPEWMEQARIVTAPSYTVVDPSDGRVVSEGVAFSASQVAAEIAPYLV